MARVRFRKIKQKNETNTRKVADEPQLAGRSERLKALVVDSFMLLMPLMYIVIYLVFGSRETFAAHRLEGWVYILVPLLLIMALFWSGSGQTPGLRAYDLRLVKRHSLEAPDFLSALLRAILMCVTLPTFGWILFFLRRDALTPHDLLSGTRIVRMESS